MTHKEKMKMKAQRRAVWHGQLKSNGLPEGFVPANINRHTGEPHEHAREKARNS